MPLLIHGSSHGTDSEAAHETTNEPQTTSALLVAVSDRTNELIFVKNREAVLVFVNAAAQRHLGMTTQPVLGRKGHTLISDATQVQQMDHDERRVLQEAVSLTLEQTLQLPQGPRTYSTTRSPWYDANGSLIGLVGVSTDITVQKQAEDLLRESELGLEANIAERTSALRELANHIETIREQEKRAIARELHDDMGATLTSLSMYLQGAYVLFPDEEAWIMRKAKIQSLLADVVATTRRMQTRLWPTMLDLFGLKIAISDLVTEFSEQTSLRCQLSLPDDDLPINSRLDIALYRMLQEILNNVAKHASATKIDVILDADEDRIVLTVRDDGIGIHEKRIDNQSTYGLRGLRERVAFLGGSISIRGYPAGSTRGTIVAITIPLLAT